MAGAKHDLREGGIRVPCIVRWPGRIAAGRESDLPCISDDFYPTMLALAGLPLKPEQHVDGVDLLLHITNSEAGNGERRIVLALPAFENRSGLPEGRFQAELLLPKPAKPGFTIWTPIRANKMISPDPSLKG